MKIINFMTKSNMINKIIISFFFIWSLSSLAQGEANNWYFGTKAGITFNNGSPDTLIDSEMITTEGCAVLSDANGQLLFYTNGVEIYNKNHEIMPNGSDLLGHTSSTLSATIVPLPNSNNLFYVFTQDIQSHPNGFRYSIVDLNLDNGNGDVTQTKNELIYTPSCEKVSVIKHENNIDYWIITHGINSNNFYCHLLTNSGLNPNPVITSIGSNIGVFQAIGSMKISPDGTKLAICHSSVNAFPFSYIELFDFNKSTGILSNHINLMSSGTKKPYGIEFSPNSLILYASISESNEELNEIYQYDLNATNIANSKINIFENNSLPFIKTKALQIGPDKKIYVAILQNPYLGVINNPNLIGSECDFISNGIYLDGKLSGSGLPVFILNFAFDPSIIAENLCFGDTTSLQIDDSTITDANWDFGDGFTSNLINTSHNYSSAGSYTVTVTASSPLGNITKIKNIIITEIPNATQPSDIILCDDYNDGFEFFDLTQQNNQILNGQPSNQFQILYFATVDDYVSRLPIENPNNFINQSAFEIQNIIAEISNVSNSECKTITNFNIQVTQLPVPPIQIPSIKICDNNSFGTDNDGKVIFDLTQNESSILNGQSANNYIITYYSDNNYINQIFTPTNYINTNNVETINVKIVSLTNSNCFINISFEIEVVGLPVINNSVTLSQCDDDNNGFSSFNLSEANELISNENLNYSYFETFLDAQNNQNSISNTSNYINQVVSNDLIYVRTQNINGCFKVIELNLNVSTTLIPSNFHRNFYACDDEASGSSNDGISNFNFSSIIPEIQALFPSGQQLEISFYKNSADALAETNVITDISNYINYGYPLTQNIFVRVENQINNECLGLGHHITLYVEKIPEIHSTEEKIICSNTPMFTEIINAGLINESLISNYSYEWYLNGIPINNATQYSISVTIAGIYSVEVSTTSGCTSTRTINLIESNSATIDDVLINDFSANNTIQIYTSGIGNYSYSLNGINYQISPYFTNVPVGTYTLFVKDLNGCDLTEKTIYVMGVPKFFTPNNDGINDYWIINNYDPNRKISKATIFDRFGKLLFQFIPVNNGWDGKYNGQTLPATDYWYALEFENGRLIKGHFSLIR